MWLLNTPEGHVEFLYNIFPYSWMCGVTFGERKLSNPAKFIPHSHLPFRISDVTEGEWLPGIPSRLPLLGHMNVPADSPFHFTFGERQLLGPPVVLSSCTKPIYTVNFNINEHMLCRGNHRTHIRFRVQPRTLWDPANEQTTAITMSGGYCSVPRSSGL